jgi:signal peptidase I
VCKTLKQSFRFVYQGDIFSVSQNINPSNIDASPDVNSQAISNLENATTEYTSAGSPTSAADASVPGVASLPTGKPRKEKKPRPPKTFWREVLETVVLTVVIFFLVKSTVQHFRILGNSMEPNFHSEQLILVNKAAFFHFDVNPWLRLIPFVSAEGQNVIWPFGEPKRGDVVIFEYPKDPTQDYIKRVIGLPGDTVEVRNGVTYVNDKAIDEPYIRDKPVANYPRTVVPPYHLFVMGDNRNGSSDSRSWGALPIDRIIGKAMFVYWPFKSGWGVVPEIKLELK